MKAAFILGAFGFVAAVMSFVLWIAFIRWAASL